MSNEIGTDWTISRWGDTTLLATLFFDGDSVIFRWIHVYIYDPNGEQIYNVDHYIAFFGFASFHLESLYGKRPGDYKIQITYWGSDDGKWPRADKWINLHIV